MKTNNIKLIIPECFKNYNLIAGITTRIGGVSKNNYESLNLGFNSGDNPEDVITNRKILANFLKTTPENFVFANQVHEANIVRITEKDKARGLFSSNDAIQNTDGMITQQKNIFITIQTADCLSIFLYCPIKKVIAILHGGWKSLYKKIITKCIHIMKTEYNVNPSNIISYLGPSISKEVYEVGNEFKEFFPESIITKNNKIFLDLKNVAKTDLIKSGISINNIFFDNYCTFRNKDLFFSYRRDGANTGRMLSFFCLI